MESPESPPLTGEKQPESNQAGRPLLAFVLPFVVFAIGTALEGITTLRPWYPWLYTLKIAAVLGLLCWGLPHYPRWNGRSVVLGFILGSLGGILWIALCTWNLESWLLPQLANQFADWFNEPRWREWLKLSDRSAYNPFSELGGAFGWIFTPIRLFGLIVVVAWMEELFWRGFLNRFLIHENWQQVPWGKFTLLSFSVITIAFVAVHPEWTAALVWAIGINVVLIWTRNLWACVAAHAGSNAVLGYYILVYQQWHLW